MGEGLVYMNRLECCLGREEGLSTSSGKEGNNLCVKGRGYNGSSPALDLGVSTLVLGQP